MPLSSTFAAGRLVARARIGREIGNASTSAQVTGSGQCSGKIVREFEFMLLSSAPDWTPFEPRIPGQRGQAARGKPGRQPSGPRPRSALRLWMWAGSSLRPEVRQPSPLQPVKGPDGSGCRATAIAVPARGPRAAAGPRVWRCSLHRVPPVPKDGVGVGPPRWSLSDVTRTALTCRNDFSKPV